MTFGTIPLLPFHRESASKKVFKNIIVLNETYVEISVFFNLIRAQFLMVS